MSEMDTGRLDEFRASLALKHCKHLGPRTWKRLMLAFGSALSAARNPARWKDLRLATVRQVEAFQKREWKEASARELEAASKCKAGILLWTDPEYPEQLREIPDPPLYLYYRGDISLLRGPGVAVVGSRKCTAQGVRMAMRICSGLSEAGVTIISGMAMGIDRQAHLSGLAGAGSSVAVLGTGIDKIYPAANGDLYSQLAAEGLVISEFAPGTGPDGKNFPHRNRIVSGLALGAVVVEAARKSGSRITARLALEQNREVYAVPGAGNTFEGCEDLIDEGAHPVASAGEVLLDLAPLIRAELIKRGPEKHLQPEPAEECPVEQTTDDEQSMSTDERRVIELLTGEPSLHIDDISRKLGMDISELSKVLLLMEVEGSVRQLSGMLYSLS